MAFPSASNAASAYLASYRQATPFEIPEHVLARDSAILLGQIPQVKAKLQADLMAAGLAEAGALARQKLVNKAQQKANKISFKMAELPYKRMTMADRLLRLRGGQGAIGALSGRGSRQAQAQALLASAAGTLGGDPLSSARGMQATVLNMQNEADTANIPLQQTVGSIIKNIENSTSPFSPDVPAPQPPAIANPYTPIEAPSGSSFETNVQPAPTPSQPPRTAPVAQPIQISDTTRELMHDWLKEYAAKYGLTG